MVKQAKHVDVVAVIICKGNRFLITRRADDEEHAPGYWSPLCGQVEENETEMETVVREVKEEIDIYVKALKKICEIPANDTPATLHWWTAEILSGEARVITDELQEIRWVTLDEMKQLKPIFESDIEIFEKYANKNN